jgi:excisionase family DNA binding protein
MASDHLTVQEAAAELRCSKAHVHNLINGRVRGVPPLPAVRLGRRKVVRRATLVAWAARRVSSTLRQPAWEFSDFRRLFRATDQVAC